MTRIILALAAFACASPALAQSVTSYDMGGYRYYNGTDSSGQPWNGSSYRTGDTVWTNLNGAGGSRTCSTTTMGNYTYTNC